MKNGENDPLAIPPEFDRRKGKNREAAVLHHDPTEPRAKKTTKETPDRHLNGPNGEVGSTLPEGLEPPDRHPRATTYRDMFASSGSLYGGITATRVDYATGTTMKHAERRSTERKPICKLLA